jgi:hypothetical protein
MSMPALTSVVDGTEPDAEAVVDVELDSNCR